MSSPNTNATPEEFRAWVKGEIVRHTDLVAALAFAEQVAGTKVIPKVVTQDEYTHDVSLRLRDDLYVVYGMT